MSEPDYHTFFRACATFRLRLADPEPLNEIEREALTEMLNAFEEMMVGARGLVEGVKAFGELLPPPQSP